MKTITPQEILDFVEYCRILPMKKNPENMARFLRCVDMARELAGMLEGGEVLPIFGDPTFHHAMKVQVVCKKATFSGEALEVFKGLVQESNVFTLLGLGPYKLEFEVSNVWEVAN